jgi:hypothetical protein
MIKMLRVVAAPGATLALIMMTTPGVAQAPTDAQREAIRSACRSDYIAHCSSVPPGGLESLQCLQKNMSSLSGTCKGAVNAVSAAEKPAAPAAAETTQAPTAAPKADTPAAAEPAKLAATAAPAAPPAAAPKAAANTAAKKPTDAQVAAIRSACRSDYPKVCAGVPTGGAPALQCLDKNKAKVSSGCQQALNATGDGAAPATGAASTAAPAAGSAAAPAAAPPVVIILRPMRPREELFVLRSACGGDVRALCGGVAPGGGRIVQCLATNAASLSPACRDVLSQFSVAVVVGKLDIAS